MLDTVQTLALLGQETVQTVPTESTKEWCQSAAIFFKIQSTGEEKGDSSVLGCTCRREGRAILSWKKVSAEEGKGD